MALKTDRSTLQTDISFFMNEAATRGGVACLSTGGSGAAMDQGEALVTYAALPSGKVPVGLLLNDMVDVDLLRQHVNQHKDEVQKGNKVTLLQKGYVVTNNLLLETQLMWLTAEIWLLAIFQMMIQMTMVRLDLSEDSCLA